MTPDLAPDHHYELRVSGIRDTSGNVMAATFTSRFYSVDTAPPEFAWTTPAEGQLYGAGDIIGIESRAIVRTEPRHWITNFETNYLPFIEFYEEDLASGFVMLLMAGVPFKQAGSTNVISASNQGRQALMWVTWGVA